MSHRTRGTLWYKKLHRSRIPGHPHACSADFNYIVGITRGETFDGVVATVCSDGRSAAVVLTALPCARVHEFTAAAGVVERARRALVCARTSHGQLHKEEVRRGARRSKGVSGVRVFLLFDSWPGMGGGSWRLVARYWGVALEPSPVVESLDEW